MYVFGSAQFVLFFLVLFASSCRASDTTNKVTTGIQPNILLILADDLGWGDTSVVPFTGNGVITPNLQAMASRGATLTNFHASATTCTPTRASILTGMNPWRSGIKAVYEYGIRGKSNRDDWLPQAPSVAEAFKSQGYFTFHSGKWHLGGMRNDDLTMRQLNSDKHRESNGTLPGSRRCPHPGPNQQGFDEYVSILDGPGAPRQNELQVKKTLYSRGCQHLLHNDVQLDKYGGFVDGLQPDGSPGAMTLSDCEAGHAVRMIKSAVKDNKPFYGQLWFHAPHGPWEYLPGYDGKDYYGPIPSDSDADKYPSCNDKNHIIKMKSRYCSSTTSICDKISNECKKSLKIVDRGHTHDLSIYRTMISSMDKALGYVLNTLKELNIDKNTLVVFTSDNGPEMDFGSIELKYLENNPWPEWSNWPRLYSTAGLRGNKRFVYEGGIRVPTIVQWIDHIPKGQNISTFGYSTDLLPTFLDAAKISVPKKFRLDGMSLMSELLPKSSYEIDANNHIIHDKGKKNIRSSSVAAAAEITDTAKYITKLEINKKSQLLLDRVVYWHNDYEGPRATAAYWNNYKFILDDKNEPFEMFDLQNDPYEINNLYTNDLFQLFDNNNNHNNIHKIIDNLTNNNNQRKSKFVHSFLFQKLLKSIQDYAKYGNIGHINYMKSNTGRMYVPSQKSDYKKNSMEYRKRDLKLDISSLTKITQGFCGDMGATTAETTGAGCSCSTPSLYDVDTYPVDGLVTDYIQPHWPYGFVNSTLLFMKK